MSNHVPSEAELMEEYLKYRDNFNLNFEAHPISNNKDGIVASIPIIRRQYNGEDSDDGETGPDDFGFASHLLDSNLFNAGRKSELPVQTVFSQTKVPISPSILSRSSPLNILFPEDCSVIDPAFDFGNPAANYARNMSTPREPYFSPYGQHNSINNQHRNNMVDMKPPSLNAGAVPFTFQPSGFKPSPPVFQSQYQPPPIYQPAIQPAVQPAVYRPPPPQLPQLPEQLVFKFNGSDVVVRKQPVIRNSNTYVVQFKVNKSRYLLARYCQDDIAVGDFVIVGVHGLRGLDCGVVCEIVYPTEKQLRKAATNLYGVPVAQPMVNTSDKNNIIRKANEREVFSLQQKTEDEAFAIQYATHLAYIYGEQVTILEAEYQFDRRKMTLYFTAHESYLYSNEFTYELAVKFECHVSMDRMKG